MINNIDCSSISIGDTLNHQMVRLSDLRCIIKVGAKKGCAFIFCGPAEEFWKSIDGLDSLYKKQAEDEITRAYEKRDELFSSFPTLEKYSKKECLASSGSYFGSFDGWQVEVEKHFSKLGSHQKRINRLETRLALRKPLRDRIIKEVYPSIQESNTIIVLIDGYEKGSAWTYEEFINGVQEEDL